MLLKDSSCVILFLYSILVRERVKVVRFTGFDQQKEEEVIELDVVYAWFPSFSFFTGTYGGTCNTVVAIWVAFSRSQKTVYHIHKMIDIYTEGT